MKIGYAFLADHCGPGVMTPNLFAETAPVKRKIQKDNRLLVPLSSFHETENLLEHVAFALAHEGVNMQILAQILPRIASGDMLSFVSAKPTSLVCRRAGWLWELFNQAALDFHTTASSYEPLFDPKRYLTREHGERNTKWKLVFNGLGTTEWCVTVERTPEIGAYIASALFKRVADWFSNIGHLNAERALGWAYLNETKGTYELENESVSASKAERFARLLRHAPEARQLTETYLCELQNEIVSNPFVEAYSYRTEQNWLANGLGASAVTYVPPSPDDIDRLMCAWQAAAERLPKETDPSAAAAIVSFGFVYLHPFMDGNGRLSRFLIHQQLAASGQLGKDQILPVSVAMKKHELEYLRTLETFSKPVRQAWQVIWTGGTPPCECTFNGHESLYRYWDATRQVEFLYKMASEALDVHLQEEVNFLVRFDKLERAVNDVFDLPQALRFQMIQVYLEQGRLSKNFRKKFALKIPQEAMDWLEINGMALLNEDQLETEEDD